MTERGTRRTSSVPFKQVDVFTSTPFVGNPVAVVLDGNDLSGGRMQEIARWTNLSETTFVLAPTRPEADYRLRIFTPQSELPFAGHPTLGSAHAVLEAVAGLRGKARLVQECRAGLVEVHVEPGTPRRLSFVLPAAQEGVLSPPDLGALADALGTTALLGAAPFDVGPIWLVAELPDAASVRALSPDLTKILTLSRRLGLTGVTVFGRAPGDGIDMEVRSFAPRLGIPEDPVCGTGNGCVAAYIKSSGLEADYVAAQGMNIGRDGRVHVRYDGARILVGGAAVTCIDGVLIV